VTRGCGLFTDTGRRVGLLRAFRTAHKQLGLPGEVLAVDVDPLAPALRVVDHAELVPRSSESAYIPHLLSLVRGGASTSPSL
jgi:hypothetical protein